MTGTASTHPDAPAAKANSTVRTLNFRLALITVLLAVVLGPAVYAWHSRELQRTAKVFLERADQLEADEKWIDAANYLRRYLSLCPGDDAVRIRMVRTFDRGAKEGPRSVRAIDIYYQTLGLISSEAEKLALRRRLIEMLLAARRYTEAESEATLLLANDKQDAEALRFRAIAVHRQMHTGAALGRQEARSLKAAQAREKLRDSEQEVFESALKSNPDDIELSAILAGFYRGQDRAIDDKKRELSRVERESRAEQLMDRMVKAHACDANAYVVRYRYYCDQKRFAAATDDLRTALRLGPDNIGVLLLAADKASRDGVEKTGSERDALFEQARAYYERILKIRPSDERAYLRLGDLDLGLGHPLKAVETWRRGLREANKESISLYLRLAGALVDLQREDDAAAALTALDTLIPLQARRLVAADRAGIECSRDFVRGKWFLLKNDVASAVPLLKRAANQGIESTNTPRSYEAWAVLGRIWSAENEWDQAASAFEQASLLLPKSAAYKLAAARAWANAGRFDAAIRYAEQALAMNDASEIRVFLVEVRYRQQCHLQESRRDWQPFCKELAEAERAAQTQPVTGPWRLRLIRAGALAQGVMAESVDKSRVEAAKLLHGIEADYPPSPALLRSLALAFEQVGCPADADRVAARIGKMPDQAFSSLLCRFRLCLLRKRFSEAREILQAALKDVPAERFWIRYALCDVSAAEGRVERASQELTQLHEEFPKSQPVVRRLAEIAWEQGKTNELLRWEESLQKLEGPDGFYWRYSRARRLLAATRNVKDKQFQEAEKLVDELQTLRPSCPGVHSLHGQIELRRGNRERAIDAYGNAIRLGEKQTEVFERLIALLYSERRFAEAEEYLAQLQEQVPLSASLSGVEILLEKQAGQLDRALQTARRGAEGRPNDPTAQVWLGSMLFAKGKVKDAERAFRKAVEIAPTDVRTHFALLALYLRTRQLDLAVKSLGELDKRVTMLPAERAFVLAQCHELVCAAGKNDEAFVKKTAELYREAQRLSPDRVAVLQRRAIFLSKYDPDAAEDVLENISRSQRVIETPGAHTSADERRLQAALLIEREGKENLLKARRILQELVADSREGTPDDHLKLAQLLDSEGKTSLAQQQYLAVVDRPNAAPTDLARYVAYLLQHGMNAAAAPVLEKLRQQAPNDLDVCGLYARWLHNQHRDSEIAPAVEALAKRLLEQPCGDDQQRMAREKLVSVVVGNIYTVSELHSVAERWYRRHVKLAPQEYRPLAMSLTLQGRLGEMVALCVDAASRDRSPQPATLLAGMLTSYGQSVGDDVLRRAEPLLTQALKDYPKDVRLLVTVADLRAMQQRIDDAITLYRRVLTLEPRHFQALNNLATMLAEQPQTRQEALRSVDDAIGVFGKKPLLLDTKGTILVQAGKPEEAVPLLKEATSAADADPRYFFHLSLACQGTGKTDEARQALREARDRKLAHKILTPNDRRLLKSLEQQLGM
jgi:tetratricopeptide (TPR) repeat protein